jgi:ribosomal-protein-serine acetyltransferase
MDEQPDEATGDPVLIDVPETLAGARVALRALRPGDGKALWEAIEESRDQLREWQTWQLWYRSRSHAELAVHRARLAFLDRKRLYYGAWHRQDGGFLGWAGLEDISWRAPSFHVGYWLRPSATGQGLMTEAVQSLCRMAVESLGAKRLALLVDPLNRRSVALARRLDFVEEGVLRNERLNAGGRLQDTMVFALTPETYRRTRWFNGARP